MKDFEIVNPLEESGWNDAIVAGGRASAFHTREWAGALSETYGYKPLYLCGREQGVVRLLVPVMEVASRLTGRRGVSLPFTDFCDPLFQDRNELDAAVDQILRLGRQRGWRRVEFRSGVVFGSSTEPSSRYLGHNLDLSASEDTLYKNLKATVRTALRKAEKNGVQVTMSASADAARQFYRLNCMTRKQHGLPPQPRRFFENLHEWMIKGDKGMVAMAESGGRAIAGAVFLHFGGTAIFKYSASDPIYQAARPNNLVMWRGVQWYREHGFQTLSLGRTRRENDGLLRFKQGWGAEERELRYFTYDLRRDTLTKDADHVDGAHNVLFRRLPIPCLRLLGTVLYKHMG